MRLGKKFKVDVSIVRESVGLKDYYDFVIDKESNMVLSKSIHRLAAV